MHPNYENLNITTYPLIDKVEDIIATWPNKKTSGLLSTAQHLSPELLSVFSDANIIVDSGFMLMNLDLTEAPPMPITGGNYEDIAQHRSGRIAWNFTLDTSVAFYEKGSSTPEFQPPTLKYPYRSLTKWTGATTQVDLWTGAGPVLMNPQIPHLPTSLGNKHIVVTLGFKDETYDTLRTKLAAYIIT